MSMHGFANVSSNSMLVSYLLLFYLLDSGLQRSLIQSVLLFVSSLFSKIAFNLLFISFYTELN